MIEVEVEVKNRHDIVVGTDQGLPPGGTSGQVLAKTSDDNYKTSWITPLSAKISLEDEDLLELKNS